MSKLQKTAVAGFVALGLYLVLGTVAPMFFDCDSVGIHKADSPDGQYRAAIGVRICKDSTQSHVSVVFANIETGSYVRRTLVKDTSITDFKLNWQRSDVVEIIVPSGVDWDDLRGGRSFESIRIEYRNAPHGEFSN